MKQWWFKFETGKWRNDSSLRRCSLETKGFWIECIAAMRESGVSELSGTIQEVARLIGCFPEEAMRCLTELKRTETADVTLGNGTVTVKSRYLARQAKVKEQTRLRVQEHRSNADVTQPVTVQSKNKSKKEEKEEDAAVAAAAPVTDPIQEVFDEWRSILNRPNAKLDKKRRTRIGARRDEGFSVAELKLVPAGAKYDPWLMGENPSRKVYDGIETLFRDAEQVERLRDLALSGPPTNGNGKPTEHVVCDECRELDGFKVITLEGKRTTVKCGHGG